MNAMRMGLLCALIGWMATDAQAQLGTYGSPDPIPLGQNASGDAYVAATANRTSYAAASDGSGPTLTPAPANIPQPPSESSAVAGMLNQPGTMANPPAGCNVMPAGGYMKDAGSGDACGGNVLGSGHGCCSPWYASFDALYMTRNKPTPVYTSAYSPPNGSPPVQQGYFNDVNWTWGEQATIGYRFGCNCDWAVEGTYWGLSESCTNGGPEGIPSCPYVTPMTFSLTSILGTTGGLCTSTNPSGCGTANQYTDQSPDHHIWRNWDAQNVEVNFVRTLCGGHDGCGGCGGCGECNRFGVDFLAGVRWFRFQDGFLFGAQRQADGTCYAGDWLYLDDRITNDLVGFQAGFNANYRFADCWKVFLTPKFGVFNNHTTLDYNLYAVSCTSGTRYEGCSQTYNTPNYPVHSTSDNFAFLTQVDLGLDWQVTQHISTQLGYRVVAMTGMALSDSQVPFYGNDTQSIADIKHNDSLLLHGVFGGLTFSW